MEKSHGRWLRTESTGRTDERVINPQKKKESEHAIAHKNVKEDSNETYEASASE